MSSGVGFRNVEKFRKRKEGKFDNLKQTYPYLSNNPYFSQLCTRIEQLRNEQFDHYNNFQFVNFKSNIRYVQKCSGLNGDEFCRLAGISKNALSLNQQFPTTIPMHSFVKCYTAMLLYIHSIEFCDMFNLSFEQVFPQLKDNIAANRLKLGKQIWHFRAFSHLSTPLIGYISRPFLCLFHKQTKNN